MYYPIMAALISKKKGNKLYYYLVESARVEGKPRIVQQTYLGTADRLADLLKQRTAPIPLAATTREFGLPGALWLAAQRSGVWDVLKSMWPEPRSGPSIAHYLLLAVIHRICQPGPKTEVADWYRSTILQPLWSFSPERFRSQDFWDAFDQIHVEGDAGGRADELEEAQQRLLAVWKDKQLVGRRLLAYDTTNFYTWTASTNQRNSLAQRGHNKQGRHNLRQVGLSYVLDGESGISLCHHVYAGNVADVEELPQALDRIVRMLDRNQIERSTVTLVFDKGTAALDNTLLLKEAGLGWISALPWNQAPIELRQRDIETLPLCSSDQPGVHAAADRAIVHGDEYLCVLKYSSAFASEQLHSVTTSLAKVLQSLRRLSMDLAKPGSRLKETQIRNKIQRWLSSSQFLEDLISWKLPVKPTSTSAMISMPVGIFGNHIMRSIQKTMKTTFMKTTLMPALAVALFSAGWLARTYAQQKAPAPLITYFSHDSVDASFAQALASSRDLYSRKDRQGKTWAIHSNSRGKSDEGVLHSHEDWTGVVVIMSGSATFVTPGSPSQTKAAKSTSAEGYQLIRGGESHRVGNGDVVIIPPNAPHMYKNIQEPFRYLVIQTP